MTHEEYLKAKDTKRIEGELLMKICEKYSIRIQTAIADLVAKREAEASCHYQMYQQAHNAVAEYEEQQYQAKVDVAIEELTTTTR